MSDIFVLESIVSSNEIILSNRWLNSFRAVKGTTKRKLMDRQSLHQDYNSKFGSFLNHIAHQVSLESELSTKTVNTLYSLLVGQISKVFCQSAINQGEMNTPLLINDDFTCQRCCELLFTPITLSCGHTFCRNCIQEDLMKTCLVCNQAIPQDKLPLYRTNFTLVKLLEKLHAPETFGRSLVAHGLLNFNKGQYPEAVEEFSKALVFVPCSHSAILHRAKAYFFLEMNKQALEDAITVCLLVPNWAEAYYVKAEILHKMDRFDDSLTAFLMCLHLNPCKVGIKIKVKQTLERLVRVAQKDLNNTIQADTDFLPRSPKRRNVQRQSSIGNNLSSNLQDFSHSSVFESHAREDWDLCAMSSNTTNAHSHLYMDDCGSDLLQANYPLGETHPVDMSLDAEKELNAFLTESNHMAWESAFDKPGAESTGRFTKSELIEISDLECSLCMRLFYEPVCTPCGHVFCRSCIERCLDHKPECPLCKQSMQSFLAHFLEKSRHACDYTTKAIIERYLPKYWDERLQLHRQEVAEFKLRQPIFVCTAAFPSVACPLHIFEPRYRLMLRRCTEYNNHEFGICMPHSTKPHSQVGTILKVRSVTYLPDGRSLVDSIGCRRFKANKSTMKDGYHVAELDYIVDAQVANMEATTDFLNKIYDEAKSWFSKLPSNVRERITEHYGEFPVKDDNIQTENGPDWTWWVLAVLPVQDDIKYRVLGKNILHERLLIIQRIFACLSRR